MNKSIKKKIFIGIIVLILFEASAWGQDCPSNLMVNPGVSTVIDCALQTPNQSYEWTSKDPTWLTYLSNVKDASPSIYIPTSDVGVQSMIYERRTFSENGLINQQKITITLLDQIEVTRLDDVIGDLSIEKSKNNLLYKREKHIVDELPYLNCISRVTVNSGELIEIPCTGLHPSKNLLEYKVIFDWAPYNETKTIATGTFEYFVHAPVIKTSDAVYMIEIFAQVPGSDKEVSASIEIHVKNRQPTITCNDIIVDELTSIELPCTIGTEVSPKFQLLSQSTLVKRGIYTEWPILSIPEVSNDTSYAITVRIFSDDKVSEENFTVKVRNTSDPGEFSLNCNPSSSEIYEGESDIDIRCEVIDASTDEIAWTVQVEGNTPLEFLTYNIDGLVFTGTFHVPTEVTQDELYVYKVVAQHDQLLDDVTIAITVLEKPDIVVTCKDVQVRTGDLPLRLMCEASNTKNLPLNYQWSWSPTDFLIDLDTGTPLFEVPVDQVELVQEYEYEVTATADLADPPSNPTKLIVTVLKNLGLVRMMCDTPIVIYEGEPEVPLNCAVSSPIVTELMWTWNLISGTEDLLIQGIDGAPPIFQTPASIDVENTWNYLIQVDDPPHYDQSEPQEVKIIVKPRPILTLECPKTVEFFVGQVDEALECKISNNQDLPLTYNWEWDPPILLSDPTIANPLFEVPLHQREHEVMYLYTVTVEANHRSNPDPVETTVDVTVLNPNALPSELIHVITSDLDFGVVRSQGQINLDPSTQQISGLVYEGMSHVGRLILQAQDSVSILLEKLQTVTLQSESSQLKLNPEWSYSESCIQFHAVTEKSKIIQRQLKSGDCHVIQLGGSIDLEDAMPGVYSGEVNVMLTLNGIEETNTIPVSLTVGQSEQAVILGSSNIDIGSIETDLYGEERVQIWPQVLPFNTKNKIASFELYNPSLYTMEVEVAMDFGYREFEVIESRLITESDVIRDLTNSLVVYPTFALLQPGESQQIKFSLTEELDDLSYAGMINFTVTPQNYINQEQRVRLSEQKRIKFQTPAVYIPATVSAQIRADIESKTEDDLTIVFDTDTVPFYGEVLVIDENDQEVGRAELLLITRSRVRINLKRPIEGPVKLEFVPHFKNQISPSDVLL